MSSYLINISDQNEKDMHLVGLISEMAKTNRSISFKKISDNSDIFNTNPEYLTNEEAELVVQTYDDEAKTAKRFTVNEAKEETLRKLAQWQESK